MTPSVASAEALAELLGDVRYVLLDFDGPVCDVFAGYPAHHIAEHLRALLTDAHGVELPDDVRATRDPLYVIRRTAELAPQLSTVIDTALRAAEVQAAGTAGPTPGCVEMLTACRDTGRPVAIVSNNSAEAVNAYLELHQLGPLVAHVQGRPHDPVLMKPNPYPLHEAMTTLGADPGTVVFIGDSLFDLDAAEAAGVPVVALANKARKLHELAHADAVTTSMQALADALR